MLGAHSTCHGWGACGANGAAPSAATRDEVMKPVLGTAGRTTAAGRFPRADERARNRALDERRERVGVEPGLGEKLTRVRDLVDTRRFQFDVDEPGGRELAPILVFGQSAGDAANPELH